jgi:hypothetical protein
MTGIMACLATLLIGVETGWKPLDGGGIELLIQIEPEMVDSLKPADRPFEGYVPPALRDKIRNWRVVVGNGNLPAEYRPISATDAAFLPPAGPELTGPGKTADNTGPRNAQRPLFGMGKWPGDAPYIATPPGKASNTAPPDTLTPDPRSKPLAEQQASYQTEQPADSSKQETKPHSADPPQAPQPEKPWVALWGAVLVAAASLFGNVYLGWIYYETRNRCRALLGGAAQAAE